MEIRLSGFTLPDHLRELGIVSIDGTLPLLESIKTCDGVLTVEQAVAVSDWIKQRSTSKLK